MKFIEYNLTDINGNSNCVIRSLCKILNKEYDEVLNGLLDTAKALNNESYNDIPVFEEYMKQNDINKLDIEQDKQIKDLKLDNGSYIVFCYNKGDFYHMIPIIDNTVYDKRIDSLELYTISIYKKNN